MKRIDVQLSPFGEYPQTREDGTEVVQVCDECAFRRLVNAFEPGEIPVDFDHGSESECGCTRAAAWLSRLWIDKELGLMASMDLTPTGEDAVAGREYRYLSPAWILDDAGRPERLVSVGFTNRPNLPVAPVLNSRQVRGTVVLNIAAGEPGGETKNMENSTKMNELKMILGLSEDADEAAILEAAKALIGELNQLRNEKAETELNEEAEEFANSCDPETPEHKEAIKNAYKISPDAVKMLAKNILRQKTQKVLNAALAKAPIIPRKAVDARSEMASLPPSERAAFYRKHREDF